MSGWLPTNTVQRSVAGAVLAVPLTRTSSFLTLASGLAGLFATPGAAVTPMPCINVPTIISLAISRDFIVVPPTSIKPTNVPAVSNAVRDEFARLAVRSSRNESWVRVEVGGTGPRDGGPVPDGGVCWKAVQAGSGGSSRLLEVAWVGAAKWKLTERAERKAAVVLAQEAKEPLVVARGHIEEPREDSVVAA